MLIRCLGLGGMNWIVVDKKILTEIKECVGQNIMEKFIIIKQLAVYHIRVKCQNKQTSGNVGLTTQEWSRILEDSNMITTYRQEVLNMETSTF